MTQSATRPRLRALALAVAVACSATVQAQQDKTSQDKATRPTSTGASDIGRISIVGEGDRLGAGQIQAEETPKARSSV